MSQHGIHSRELAGTYRTSLGDQPEMYRSYMTCEVVEVRNALQTRLPVVGSPLTDVPAQRIMDEIDVMMLPQVLPHARSTPI